MAEMMAETVFGEACKNLTRTIITIMKRGITEKRKLKAQAPAKDKSLFCRKYFVVRKTLCEKVTNVILRGFFLLINNLTRIDADRRRYKFLQEKSFVIIRKVFV